jgi:hypothetical protein
MASRPSFSKRRFAAAVRFPADRPRVVREKRNIGGRRNISAAVLL